MVGLHHSYLIHTASSSGKVIVTQLDWIPKDTPVAHSPLKVLDKTTLPRWKKDVESASFVTCCGKHRWTFTL